MKNHVNAVVSRASGKPAPIVYAGETVGFGCDDLHVATIPVWLARLVNSHFHYSKRVVNNSYLHLGIFDGRDLVGVMQWGYAMNPSSGARCSGHRQPRIPAVEWVQTFADERCGWFGAVYQASNFHYVGSHKTTFYELGGEWYHKIAMTMKGRKAGSRGNFLQENAHRATAYTFNQFRFEQAGAPAA